MASDGTESALMAAGLKKAPSVNVVSLQKFLH